MVSMSKKSKRLKEENLGSAPTEQTYTDETYAAQLESLDSEETQEERVIFDAWFSLRLSKKAWLRDSVRSFMKSEGLSNKEKIETFDAIYKKF